MTSAGAADSAHAAAAGMPGTIRFQGMAAPSLADPEAMARVTVGSKMGFDGPDQAGKISDLSYEAFFKTGDGLTEMVVFQPKADPFGSGPDRVCATYTYGG